MSVSSDKDTLHLLSIFHYVLAGLIALVACFPLIHFTIGLSLIFGSVTAEEPALGLMGGMFAALAGIIILIGWGLALLVFLAGKNLDKQKKYQLCMVGAAVLCIFMPLGTILGVFTLVTLSNDSVKSLFEESSTPEISVEEQ
jgi:hypothetical protein